MRIFTLLILIVTIFCSCRKDAGTNPVVSEAPAVSPATNTNIPASTPKFYTVLNKGISRNNTFDLLARVDTAVLAKKPDLVIMMIGTNDVRTAEKIIPVTQYQYNLEKLIAKIKGSGSELLLLSPTPIGTTLLTYPNVVNQKIDTVTNIIAASAKKFNCLYLDINKEFKTQGTPNATAKSLLNNAANTPLHPDGLHLTKEGNLFIATSIYNYLKANNKLTYYNVICFGDSLTSGLYLTGDGTTTGDTYPAALYNLLNK